MRSKIIEASPLIRFIYHFVGVQKSGAGRGTRKTREKDSADLTTKLPILKRERLYDSFENEKFHKSQSHLKLIFFMKNVLKKKDHGFLWKV